MGGSPMTIPRELQAEAAPYLDLFGRGVESLRSVAGRVCTPLPTEVRVRVPEGAGALLLKLGVPKAVVAEGPAPLVVLDEEGRTLARGSLARQETLLLVRPGERAAFLLRFERSFEAEQVGLEPASCGALLLDVEVLRGPVRGRFDLAGMEARGARFLTLRMDLTNKCNLRCRMCSLSFDEVFHQPKDYLGVAEFEALAAQVLPSVHQLSLSAGYEPLLHPDLPEALAIARRHGVPFIELTTNGMLLKEEVARAFVEQGLSRVTLSVDGVRPETFEYVRRGARFDRLLEVLATLARVKRDHGADHPELSLQMVLMRRNVEELPDVIRLGARYGMTVFHSVPVIPFAGLGMEDESLEGDRERANAVFAEARTLVGELGIEAQIPPDFDLDLPGTAPAALVTRDEGIPVPEVGPPSNPDVPFDPMAGGSGSAAVLELELPPPAVGEEVGTRPTRPGPRDFAAGPGGTLIPTGFASHRREAEDGDGTLLRPSCIYPWTMAVVRPDRHVVPCCQWHAFETMGSLAEHSFAEIWNGEAYRRLRLELQSGRYHPTCAQCPERRRV